MQQENKINTGDEFVQAEVALCIWEYILSKRGEEQEKGDMPNPYIWIGGEQGAAHARTQSIEIAHLVEMAYQFGLGEDNRLDGWCFDWDIVPVIVVYFMGRSPDGTAGVTIEHAKECGTFLPGLMDAAGRGT